jgi:LmbE family N-acetylglucosaminyl deacetylase
MRPDALRLLRGEGCAEPVLLVVAHPDDETIGAGARLSCLRNARILYVTDGAPLDRRWWGDPSVASREEYARVRQEELRGALALAGISDERVDSLGFVDQRASNDLAALALHVEEALRRWRPSLVVTHPYEGGHPDHDACAFAVHTARRMLQSERGEAPGLVEFASYHADGDGGLATGRFLGAATGIAATTFVLSSGERDRKQQMLGRFRTQQSTLAAFRPDVERFRCAPAYDFTRAPHEGVLNYERYGWGVTGPEWRGRARGALDALGVGAAVPPPGIEQP